MDYEAIWKRLNEELVYLAHQDVKSIDPHVVLSYMAFLQEIEEQKHEQSDKG